MKDISIILAALVAGGFVQIGSTLCFNKTSLSQSPTPGVELLAIDGGMEGRRGISFLQRWCSR